ncbi:cell division protein FtsK [Actinoplanes sp. SE50]|uniref:cell division protein FtsK n=1 Tax=unclassified Actinoplanes TaxID=2626549 RepID=UPI00023EBC1E|nr:MULTISPECIES: cell division protein FtsK [unclassified Actinoplanes]AEV86845.1 cell division FtsK/SpoIIIE [Actinoplanes sp. SE50/110]ATO85242.1 cell division protein FtsK [Actinoplanes sp. SE50]SLM02652.1 hypothetical protein ACSP50_5934 [Actinoplanes sp. SE50/110]
MSVDQRPAPTRDMPPGGSPPTRPRTASRGPDGQLTVPSGAAFLSWHYRAADGKTVKARKQPVPVSDGGELTHYEMECPACPDSGQWVSVKSKVHRPLCAVCCTELRRPGQRQWRLSRIPVRQLLQERRAHVNATATTAAVGAAGLVLDAADFPWWGEIAQAAAVPACVAGSWWFTRAWLTRYSNTADFPDPTVEPTNAVIAQRARTAAYLAAAAGVWCELADAINLNITTGDGGLAVAALLGLGVIGSRPYLRWAQARRVPAPQPAIDEDDEPVDDTPQPTEAELLRAYVLERWEKVSVKGRVLHGTRLEDIMPSVGGWSGRIIAHEDSDLDPEKFDTAEPLRKIARAYSVGTSMVSIVADPFDANQATILVQRTSPLTKGNDWSGNGIDLKTGFAETMTLEDGTRGRHPFWRPGWGAVMELIAGATGAGKSEYLNLLAALERQSGVVVSWIGDPQMGQSLGDLRDGVDWFAPSVEEILVMLRVAAMVMIARNLVTTRMRREETRPDGRVVQRRVKYREVSPDFPLLAITIDEAHIPMNDPDHGKEITKLLALLSKSGRKANIKVRLLSQSVLLSEIKDSVLRGQLASGFVAVFRTADKLTGTAAWPGGRMPGDPANLPAAWEDGFSTAGLGYASSTKRMRMRTDYAGDLYDLITTGDTLGLEASVLGVAGPLYADRWKRLEAFDSMDPAELLGAGIPANLLDSAPGDTAPPTGGREAVLRFFAERWLDGDRDPVPFGELAGAVRTVIKTRACTNAVNKLVDEQILATDKGAYWLTESGAEQMGVLEEVPA